MSTEPLILDDRDPAVTYTGAWNNGGAPAEHDGTVKWSTTPGASFVVSFTGTSIGVYGTIDSLSKGVVTSYSIDRATPTNFIAPVEAGDTYKQLFFQSNNLTSGPHTLTVEMVSVNPNPDPTEGTIWFDFFSVVNDPSSSSTSTTSTTSPASKTSGSAPSKHTTSSTPSTSNSAAPATSHSSSHTGGIVGAVFAILLVLAAIISFFLFYRRRKQRQGLNSTDYFAPAPSGPSLPPMGQTSPPVVAAAASPFASQANRPASPAAAYPFALGPSPSSATPASMRPGYVPPPAGAGPPSAFPGYPAHVPPSAFPGYPTQSAPSGAFPPSSYAASYTSASHGSRPSLDATSVSSSTGTGIPPSRGFFYVQNDSTVLTYKQPNVGPAAAPAPLGPSSSVAAAIAGGDSIAELKKRQQEAVANYNQGLHEGMISAQPHQVVQHVDSGIRTLPADTTHLELPPVYSAS